MFLIAEEEFAEIILIINRFTERIDLTVLMYIFYFYRFSDN